MSNSENVLTKDKLLKTIDNMFRGIPTTYSLIFKKEAYLKHSIEELIAIEQGIFDSNYKSQTSTKVTLEQLEKNDNGYIDTFYGIKFYVYKSFSSSSILK